MKRLKVHKNVMLFHKLQLRRQFLYKGRVCMKVSWRKAMDSNGRVFEIADAENIEPVI